MRRASLVVLALLALPPVTWADPYPQQGECDSAGTIGLHRVEVTGGAAGSTMYVDDEGFFGNGIWLYTESNGVWVPKAPGVYFEGLSNANLQRGSGQNLFVPDDLDNCYDADDGGNGGDRIPDLFTL